MIPEVDIDAAPAGYDNAEASAWANGYESAREAAQVVIERLQADVSFRSGVTLTVQRDLEAMQRQRDKARADANHWRDIASGGGETDRDWS